MPTWTSRPRPTKQVLQIPAERGSVNKREPSPDFNYAWDMLGRIVHFGRTRAHHPTLCHSTPDCHALKIAPNFRPISSPAPTSVAVNSAIPQTPIALAT